MITDITNTPHYTWGNDCDSWILCEAENLNVKQEKMPPETQEQLHYHKKTQQFFYILKGTATFIIDGEIHEVKALQGITIPPSSKHYIANQTENNLEFLVISQPPVGNDRVNIEE